MSSPKGAPVLAYPCSLPLSAHTLTWLAEQIRTHRAELGSRWRRLDPGRQALLVLAHLRCGDTYARLAGGFEVSITTVFRYIREVVDLLAAAAPSLRQVIAAAARRLYVIVDGTLIPIDRIAVDRPYFSGKHHRHGMNVQVLAGSRGHLLWASPALPGAVHDLAAARIHHIPELLARHGVAAYGDAAYQGAGPHIAVPFRRWPRKLSRNQKAVNRNQARNRAPGERAVAILKCWRLLAKLRCCPHRTTAIIAAIRVLQTIEEQPQRG
jgi:hypothetical protein